MQKHSEVMVEGQGGREGGGSENDILLLTQCAQEKAQVQLQEAYAKLAQVTTCFAVRSAAF